MHLPLTSALPGLLGLCLRLPRPSGQAHSDHPSPPPGLLPEPHSSLQCQHPLGFSDLASLVVFSQSAISHGPFFVLSLPFHTCCHLSNHGQFQTSPCGTPASQVSQPQAFTHSGIEAPLPLTFPPSEAFFPSPQGPASFSPTLLSQPGLPAASHTFPSVPLCRLPRAWNAPFSGVHRIMSYP